MMSRSSPSTHGGVQTPLLGRLLNAMDERQRIGVVDFGLGSSSVLETFAPYRVRLDTLDIFPQLERWEAADTQDERRALIQAHVDGFELEGIDWILSWSLLNYTAPLTATLLFDALRPRMRPTTAVHALIEYSSPEMPASPPSWTIRVDENDVSLTPLSSEARTASPRHTPKRLEGMLGGMKAQSTVLLSNGLQEYIFRPSGRSDTDS